MLYKTPMPHDEVEALKQELADFAYVVSHDLKAPMRHMREFSRILMKRLDHAIGPDEQKFVTIIEDASAKADAMLMALQEISRLYTRQQPFSDVNLAQLVPEAVGHVQHSAEDAGARILIHDLPVVEGDETQLRQLFIHLLCNALDHAAPTKNPVIEVTSITSDNTYRILVCDNGPGVADEAKERIFGLFKKGEHVPDSHMGTGLYLCQKIAQRHDGILQCEDSESGGACFSLTLPR